MGLEEQVGYFTYEELSAFVSSLAESHPHLIRLESVGESPQGRSLWLLTITDLSTGEPENKPAIWIDGNTHAAELASSSAVLYTCARLCSDFESDEAIASLLRRNTIYALPRISPDGAEHVLSTGRSVRSSPKHYPDAEKPGLRAKDVDGDGRILQMRQESPSGPWKASEKDDRILLARQPDDIKGPFYHLYPEGVFEGFDPQEMKVGRPPEGLDFNRNYPSAWRPEQDQLGAGPYPLSEPETRAVVEAVQGRKNINALIAFHTYCGAILRPPSSRPDSDLPPSDLKAFTTIGARGEETTGYPCLSVYSDFRYNPTDVISGVFDDWAYWSQGLISYTVELWNLAKEAGVEIDDYASFFFRGGRTEEDTVQILSWCDEKMTEMACHPWKKMEHPQLGSVEIGGWDRVFSWQNPPKDRLVQECERVFSFVLTLARSTPLIEAAIWEVEPLGEDLHRVRVRVENTGYLPTSGTRLAAKGSVAPTVKVALGSLSGLEVVDGRETQDLGHLNGVVDILSETFVDSVYFGGADQGQVGWATWIVRGSGQAEISVAGGRAGFTALTLAVDGKG